MHLSLHHFETSSRSSFVVEKIFCSSRLTAAADLISSILCFSSWKTPSLCSRSLIWWIFSIFWTFCIAASELSGRFSCSLQCHWSSLACRWLCSCLACCWLCSSAFFHHRSRSSFSSRCPRTLVCFTSFLSPQARWLWFRRCFSLSQSHFVVPSNITTQHCAPS